MSKLASAALFAALAFGPLAAHAAVYSGSRAVNGDTAAFSITTDGTFGVIGQSNIIDWSFSFTDPTGTQTATAANDVFEVDGTSLSASATELTFDFSGVGVMAFAHVSSFPIAEYCVDGAQAPGFGCESNVTPGSEHILFLSGVSAPDDFSIAQSGVQVLATASGGGVPEPAAWSLLIAGFGLTGAALRGRRATALALRA